MSFFLSLLVNAVPLGAIYAIVALGFVVVFKATSVLNFGHGAFVMLATYLALTFFVTLHWPFLAGLLMIAALFAVLGVVLHYTVMQWMVGQAFFSVVLVTIGFEIIIRAALLVTYGPTEKGRINILPSGLFEIGGMGVSRVNVVIVGAATLVVVAFLVFFRYTRLGMHMRALADNLEGAAAQGIVPNHVYAAAWSIGLVLAAIGGVLYSNYTSSIDLSISAIGLRAFPAAVVGGLDSIGGAIVGGLLVGFVETMGAGYLGAEWRDILAFGIMFLVLFWRPSGLFGTKQFVRV